MDEGTPTILLWALKVVVCGVVFFLPLLIACWRRHRQRVGIAILNLLAPLAFVFPVFVFVLLWIAALLWAVFPLRPTSDELPLDLNDEVLELTEEA